MTPDSTTPAGSSAHAGPAGRPGRLQSLQLSAVVWLTMVWIALWGDISVANVVGGVAVGTVVSLVFPLPPLRMGLRIHPVRLVALVLRFLLDVVAATSQVTHVVLTAKQLRNAVIEVNLSTPSDLVLTIVAEMTSLVPGSVVVEVRRSSHTLFLHVLDTPDGAAAERMRERTLDLERRVIGALGAPPSGPTESGEAR